MDDTERAISRLRVLAQIESKFQLVEQLRSRVSAKTADIQQRCEKGGEVAVAVLNSNAEKIGALADRDKRAGTHFDETVRKFREVSQDAADATNADVDRVFTYTLKSLDRLQSMFETELLDLDSLTEELDRAIQSNPS